MASILRNRSVRAMAFIWLAWGIILIGYQTLINARFQPYRPDRALEWTPSETARNSQNDKPYLIEPFMNNQVSWDSEFYLSIATVGYDDPDVRVVRTPEGGFSMNYAFYPLYPLTMRVVAVPLRLLGLNPIATSTLAGVMVSLAGTLAAMLALYDLTRDELGEDGGIRTAFYLLIFPSSFFLAQVYTEGLFAGLAFGCLALLKRKYLAGAALLAALATWTRAVGAALIVPLALAWAREVDWKSLSPTSWRVVARGVVILAPVGAYLMWSALLGTPFRLVDEAWFGRGLFNLDDFSWGVERAVHSIFEGDNSQMRVYFLLEFSAVIVALVACLDALRRDSGLALFGLLALMIAVPSGAPQSLIRYVLAIPALFIFLSRLGRSAVFDRAWTVGSVLVMGMQTALFTFDMWVA